MPDPLKKKKRTIHPNSLKALEKSRKPFVKGDPRINRKGAPDTTSDMRALIRSIGADLIQLREETASGRKRTKIVSRITKKLLSMYESDNPSDSLAILKAGWPGLLEADEDKKPREFVLKVVYENKRVIEEDEPDIEEGIVKEAPLLDAGAGGGNPIIGVEHHPARWGQEVLQQKNENGLDLEEQEGDTGAEPS